MKASEAKEFVLKHIPEACAFQYEGYGKHSGICWVIIESAGLRFSLGEGGFKTESEAWKGAKRWLTGEPKKPKKTSQGKTIRSDSFSKIRTI